MVAKAGSRETGATGATGLCSLGSEEEKAVWRIAVQDAMDVGSKKKLLLEARLRRALRRGHSPAGNDAAGWVSVADLPGRYRGVPEADFIP